MRRFHAQLARRAGRSLVVAALALAAACSQDATSPSGDMPGLARGGGQGPDLRAAMAAQARHEADIMKLAGVEGVGVGTTEDGREGALVILTEHGAVGGIRREYAGVKVRLIPTGKIVAGPQAKGGNGGGGSGGTADPTATFQRPVPIGVSIGNVGSCSAGTLGARVKRGTSYFILSNNHVLAEQNDAPLGSSIIQPGRYDTDPQCSTPTGGGIASLSQFVAISYSGNNTVDAAIASTTTGNVGNGTFTGGYGLPNSTTAAAQVNMAVQKCGRTTGCTKGTVGAINATVNVQYSGGVARFVNQVVITGKRGAFSRSGDSGSLIVTDNASANPVALLFAGGQTTTIGNPISAVLSALNVTIDGK
jgi:hypothetical protein